MIEPPRSYRAARTARARDLFADAVAASGPAYANAAESIRTGWANLWVQAGIAALDKLLADVPEDDE